MDFLIFDSWIVNYVSKNELIDITINNRSHLNSTPKFLNKNAISLQKLHPKKNFFFDGYVFLNKLFHSRLNLDEVKLSDLINVKCKTGCFVAIDNNESFTWMFTDDLGQYPVFILYNKLNKAIAVSNNIYLLKSLAKTLKIDVTPNIENAVNLTTYLSSLQSTPVFNKISRLKPGASIKVKSNGILEIIYDYSWRSKTFYENSEDLSEKQLIDLICKKLKSNINCLLELKLNNLLVDLSGGFDSRLVLASILGIDGASNAFKYFNINNTMSGISADRDISLALMKIYKLTGGIGITDKVNSTATHNSLVNFPRLKRIKLGSINYNYELPYAFEDYGELEINEYVRTTGYLGEHTQGPGLNFVTLFKSLVNDLENPLNSIDKKGSDYVATNFASHLTVKGQNNGAYFLKKEAQSILTKNLKTYFQDIFLEPKLPIKLFNSILYTENRSRFHFGNRIAKGNQRRIVLAPLGVPEICSALKFLNYGEIITNKLGYLLMTNLGGKKLSWMPFANKRWSKNVIGEEFDQYLNHIENTRNDISGLKFPEPIKLGAIEDVKKENYENFISEIPSNSDAWEVFDRELLLSYIKSPLEFKYNMKTFAGMNFERIMSALTFLESKTIPPQISGSISLSSYIK